MKFKIVEGLSNFNNELRQDVVEFFEKKWEECNRKRKSGTWVFRKTYTDSKTKKKTRVFIIIETKRLKIHTNSYVQSIVNRNQHGATVYARIILNLTPMEKLLKGKWEKYYHVLSTLEHEITHVSQKINKSMKDRKISFNDYKKTHSDFAVEKEAELVYFFGLLKRYTPIHAAQFFLNNLEYWENIGFGYKTFLKKAADYGLTNKEISKFIRGVRKWCTDYELSIPVLDINIPKKESKDE